MQGCSGVQCEVCGVVPVVMLELGPLDPRRAEQGSQRWCSRCWLELASGARPPAAPRRPPAPIDRHLGAPAAPGPGVDAPALTVRQPWAWAIVHARKRYENRDWTDRYRGWIWLHAAKGCTRTEYSAGASAITGAAATAIEVPPLSQLARGAIIAACRVVAILDARGTWTGPPPPPAWIVAQAPWRAADGYAWALSSVLRVEPPVPCTGARGLWMPPRAASAQAITNLQRQKEQGQ